MSDYLAGLRTKIGHDMVQAPGVTVIVIRPGEHGDEVLLARRSDTAQWTPICGAVDPGEDPDVAALRELREEACVEGAVDRLISMQALPVTTYVNGDQLQYLDIALRCRLIGGEARVGDDENDVVRWYSVTDLPPMNARFRRTIELALDPDAPFVFGHAERPLNCGGSGG